MSKAQLDEYNRTLVKNASLYIIASNFDENIVSKYKETFDDSVTTIEEFFNSAEERVKDAIIYYEVFFKGIEIPEWKFIW